jgi:hypothetical protein
VVLLPKGRVLRAMPPLQPLGKERHRQPSSPERRAHPRSAGTENGVRPAQPALPSTAAR